MPSQKPEAARLEQNSLLLIALVSRCLQVSHPLYQHNGAVISSRTQCSMSLCHYYVPHICPRLENLNLLRLLTASRMCEAVAILALEHKLQTSSPSRERSRACCQ